MGRRKIMERAFKESLADFLKDRKMSPQAFAAAVGVGKKQCPRMAERERETEFSISEKKFASYFGFLPLTFCSLPTRKRKYRDKTAEKGRFGGGRKENISFSFFFSFINIDERRDL